MASPKAEKNFYPENEGKTDKKADRKPRDPNTPLSPEEFIARVRKHREAERALMNRVPQEDRALAQQLLDTIEKARKPAPEPY